MSFDYQLTDPDDFGGFGSPTNLPIPGITDRVQTAWPKQDTSWDSFDPVRGFAFNYKPSYIGQGRSNNDRVSNFGVELSRPHVAEEGAEGNLLLPFGEGPLNPRTQYDFWNPAQAFDTLATVARAFIPGVNDAGNWLGQMGTSIANSDFGRMLSDSPLAAAGTFAGEVVGGIIKGGFQTVGDFASPWEDMTKSYSERDFGGTALATLRLLSGFGLAEKTNERFQGFLKGDEEMTEQLADEFSFFTTIATLGVGSATGFLARGGAVAARQASRVGILKAAGTAAQEGYTMSPLLNNIATATKFGLAGGYGLEAGSEISAHIFPDWDKTNKFIATQTFVPNDSPLRGAWEFGVAGLVDPLPALGKLGESAAARKMLDSGIFRLPSPAQRAAAFMPGGMKGVKNPEQFSQYVNAMVLPRVALKLLEDQPGIRVITDDMIAKKVEDLIPTLRGDGPRNLRGLASDHTNLMADITKILQQDMAEMGKHFPKYKNTPMTMADYQGHLDEIKVNWSLIDSAGGRDMMMVRAGTLTDQDFVSIRAKIEAVPGFNKNSNNRMQDTLKATIANDFPEVVEYMAKGSDRPLNFTQKGFYNALQRYEKYAPKEPTKGSIAAVAAQIRGNKNYKVIVKGSNPKLKDEFETFDRYHPAAKEAEEILKMRFDPNEPITLKQLFDMYEKEGFDDAARLIAKWQFDHSAMYSKGGVIRPVLRMPDEGMVLRMPGESTKLGNIISGFREYIPNTELGRKMQENFHRVHNKAWGLTREESERYADAIRDAYTKNEFTHAGQWANSSSPVNAGRPLANLAEEMFGKARIGKTNPGQLLEESMPSESWAKLTRVLLGLDHGEVGVVGSLMQGLRAKRADRLGDWYRWWAQVGHPTLRYDISPIFQIQLPFENIVYRWLRGVSHASHDGLLAPAVNDAIDKVAKGLGGKTLGEQRNIGMFPTEALASERMASKGSGSSKNIAAMADKMFDQVMKELPETFADRMRQVMPADYALLRKSYSSNKELVDAILQDGKLKEKWFRGEIAADEVLSKAQTFHKEETVRLYRGETGLRKYDPAETAQIRAATNPERGRWFSANKEFAADYGNTWDPSVFRFADDKPGKYKPKTTGKVYYVDVPKADLAKYHPSFAKEADTYVLPADMADAKRLLSEADDDIKSTVSSEVFSQIETQLKNAMRDSVRQAQTTYISNPMRKYWERSFSHPVLMYPLSWTLKAAGEWARFLTHSAFGLKTGMSGYMAWGELQNATLRALINDPEAMEWIEDHAETIKIMEYMLPGVPSSPIPGDNGGVGFGLMSLPLRNAVQLGWNIKNGLPVDDNMSDMSKIGLIRDMKVFPKLWSEWALGKSQTTVSNPGLTVGKTRFPNAFDEAVEAFIGDDPDLRR